MTTNRRRAPTSSRPTAVRVRALVGIACAGLAAVVLAAAGEGPQRALAVDDTVMVKMRDGVHLAATVYRPADADRLPTLVTRTPYDRRNDATEARRLAARGYVVVVQDTRGRFGSEGEFYPFRDEGTDGYDTVEWAAALPFSDGRVGMYGASYVGATQLLAAMEKPEPITPGSVNRYVIDLWATSNVFKAGHRARVNISSSNFPRFDRNLNTGEPILGATRMVTARQTVYHDVARPSAVLLPVIR